MQDLHQYEDIIDLPHHVSRVHPRMDAMNRAAQFSPFAALTGYEDAIEETARLTFSMIELDDNERELLDQKLAYVRAHLDEKLTVSVTFFKPDLLKDGGSYETYQGVVKQVQEEHRLLSFEEGQKISLDSIVYLELLS